MIKILLASGGPVAATLRIPRRHNDVPVISGWEEHSIINVGIVGVVDDKEPRSTHVGKPCFHLLKSLRVCPTQFPNVDEGLFRCFFTASVDPENAPETVAALLDDRNNCVYLCGDVSLFSMVICKLQAHLTLSNSAITKYDKNLSLLGHLGLGP